MQVTRHNAKSILTPTCGFLTGYTHTFNPAIGCPFGKGFCGQFCYAGLGMFAAITVSRATATQSPIIMDGL